ncbi:M28 family peptidase, partial [Pseudomonadales bacterium]|nr:M28 family peptidase [Pseudomonadales bacterium]
MTTAQVLSPARVLKREGPLLHPIMLIFTDAEEVGLVGAEAFFQQHPLNDQVGIVLNAEGSGSSGGSMVIRTSNNNALMLKSYAEDHQDPYGF